MYHRVLRRSDSAYVASHPGMVVGLDSFRMHVQEYAERYRVVPLGQLVTNAPSAGKPLLSITFDDGWRDTLELAIPALDEAGLTASIFAAVRFVEAGERGDPYITRSELRELAARGFDIGGHTWSHRELPDVPDAELHHELVDSRAWLEDAVGGPIVHFAYPRGKFDTRSVDLARANYAAAVTVQPGFCTPSADRALLPRLGVHDDVSRTLARLRWRLAGLP